jgi:hypothetical protein
MNSPIVLSIGHLALDTKPRVYPYANAAWCERLLEPQHALDMRMVDLRLQQVRPTGISRPARWTVTVEEQDKPSMLCAGFRSGTVRLG